MNEDGTLMGKMQLLICKGFRVGNMVRRRSDQVEGKLIDVNGDSVILNVDGKRMSVSCCGFLKGEWTTVKIESKQVTMLKDMYNPLESPQMTKLLLQHRVIIAINDLLTRRMSSLKKIYMTLEPKKEVFAAMKISADQLWIVPVTLKVSLHDTLPHADALQVLGHGRQDTHCTISPMRMCNDHPIPFWNMSASRDAAEVNMVMTTTEINGLEIPVLKNSRDVMKDERLAVAKAAAEIKQPETLVEIDDEEKPKRGRGRGRGGRGGRGNKRGAPEDDAAEPAKSAKK